MLRTGTWIILKIAFFTSLALLCAGIFAASCASATAKIYKEIDSAVSNDDFASAVNIIIKGQEKRNAVYSEKNSILLFLDKGLLEHYAGNYAVSSADLQNAERLIEEAYTKSISENFFSYILNDNVKEYPGEDFENIYLNVFNALNYYHRGNLEGALVEIRKLSGQSGKLNMLSRRYEYIDPDSGENLNDYAKRETGVMQIPETKSVNFSNSALARFLCALFYLGEGDKNSARIEFDQVYSAYNMNRNIYRSAVPNAVEQARNVPEGKARLNIISFTGLSPVKEQQLVIEFLPFQHPILQVAFFKLPILVKRPSLINRIEVTVEEQGSFNLELIEDIGAVIEETYIARFSNIFAKTYIRTIIKYAVADVLAIVTAESQDELAGLFVALAARAGMDASESADIRMSRYLPDNAYIGGINLDPGIYKVYINYYNGDLFISGDKFDNVIIDKDRLNLLQSVNLK